MSHGAHSFAMSVAGRRGGRRGWRRDVRVRWQVCLVSNHACGYSAHGSRAESKRNATRLNAASRKSGASVMRTCRTSRQRLQTRRSEEHTSELQSHHDLVCRLLLEKKKC